MTFNAISSPVGLACSRRHDRDARRLYERLLGLRNDVGLLSEEYDPRAKRLVGNFPQAFSHIAIINTAHNLTRKAKPAEQRCESKSLDEQEPDPAASKARA